MSRYISQTTLGQLGVIITPLLTPSPPPASASLPQSKTTAKKPGRGRLKGSKNKDKTAVSLNPELLHIKSMITALFDLIAGAIRRSLPLRDHALRASEADRADPSGSGWSLW